MSLDRHYQIHAHTVQPPDYPKIQGVMAEIGLTNFTISSFMAYNTEGAQPSVVVAFIINGDPDPGEKNVAVEVAGRLAKAFGVDTVLLSVTPTSCALISDQGKVLAVEEEPRIIAANDGGPTPTIQ